jgi:hypothetical protein
LRHVSRRTHQNDPLKETKNAIHPRITHPTQAQVTLTGRKRAFTPHITGKTQKACFYFYVQKQCFRMTSSGKYEVFHIFFSSPGILCTVVAISQSRLLEALAENSTQGSKESDKQCSGESLE